VVNVGSSRGSWSTSAGHTDPARGQLSSMFDGTCDDVRLPVPGWSRCTGSRRRRSSVA
jgi:hypothetical protein